MDTIHEGFGFLIFFDFTDSFGYFLVGEEHEFLDQFVRLFRAFKIDSRGFPVFVNVEAHFNPVECDSPVLEPGGPEFLCQIVEC